MIHKRKKNASRLRDTDKGNGIDHCFELRIQVAKLERGIEGRQHVLVLGAAWEHPAYLSYFIASFCFLPCLWRWQMPAQGSLLRKIITSLLCSVFKWFFPGSREYFYSIFQSLPEKVFQNWIFYQKGEKIQTRHIYQEGSFENPKWYYIHAN